MLLPLQGVNAMAIRNPGCRFACPGLCAVALSGRADVHSWLQKQAEHFEDFEHPTFQGVHFRLRLRSFKNNAPKIISLLIGATTNVAQVATGR